MYDQKKLKHLANAADDQPSLQSVMAPKNYKQVANTIARERKNKFSSADDIYGLYLLHDKISNYVRLTELIPNYVVVLFTSNMLDIFKAYCKLSEMVLHYDTTFNIGDFFLSILAYSNTQFLKTAPPFRSLIACITKKIMMSTKNVLKTNTQLFAIDLPNIDTTYLTRLVTK